MSQCHGHQHLLLCKGNHELQPSFSVLQEEQSLKGWLFPRPLCKRHKKDFFIHFLNSKFRAHLPLFPKEDPTAPCPITPKAMWGK